ncbi:MAG: hypothetical protein DMG53_27940 [Acidobacteria bacterium]|nr:MAG: hypothetical protein DMG53_27940 [Acidobacteriota bacterium]
MALNGRPHELHFRPGFARPTAFHDGRSALRIRWCLAQIEFRLSIRYPDAGPGSGNLYVLLAGNDGNGRKHLLQILLFVRPDLGAHLFERLHGFAVDEKHPLSRRQEDTGCHLQARVHVHNRLNFLGLLLRVDLFGQSILFAFFLCRGPRRGLPIHHRGGDLLPITPLRAHVANSFSLPLIIPDQLKASVLQHQLLCSRQSRHSRLPNAAAGLPLCGGLLLFR